MLDIDFSLQLSLWVFFTDSGSPEDLCCIRCIKIALVHDIAEGMLSFNSKKVDSILLPCHRWAGYLTGSQAFFLKEWLYYLMILMIFRKFDHTLASIQD